MQFCLIKTKGSSAILITLFAEEPLEIRKLIVDNYIVFYRIKNDNIEILRIMYGRRNWINLL